MADQKDLEEKLNKALNELEEGKPQTPATPAEEKPAEEVAETEAKAKPTGEAEAEGEATETEEKSKKGYSQRIRELNAKAKAAEAKAASLAEKLEELTGAEASSPPPLGVEAYQPQVQPGAEITPEQYKQDVVRTADSIATLRVKQESAINRINSEANEVVRSYPELDPESEKFDKDLSETVTEAVEAYVKADPYNASVKKFVAKLMKPYKRAVTKGVGKVTETIAKQVSETATRPTSVAKSSKKFEELSLKEMEKKLGVVS